MSDGPIDKALAIARGLIVTGQAKAVQRLWDGGYIKMFAGKAVHWWVRHDGGAVYRVVDDGAAEQAMLSEFVDEMAGAGDTSEGRQTDLSARVPSPQDDPSIYDSFDWPYRPPGWINPIRASRPERLRDGEKKKR
jgi:hypothetical protein